MKAIFFDLDGTLLPLDEKLFVDIYFAELSKVFSVYNIDSKKLVETIWTATHEIIKNDGKRTNEEAFWDKFNSNINIDLSKVEAIKTKCERGEQNCDECKIICDRIKSNDTAFNDWKETCDRDKSIVAQKNKEEVERLIKVIQPFSSLLNKIPELYSINSSHLYDLIGKIDLNTTKALTKLIKNSNDTEKLSIKSMSDAIDILTEQMRSIEEAKLEISNMLK